MSARILVVDDILPNVKLLEAKLMSQYYEVVTAVSNTESGDVMNQSVSEANILVIEDRDFDRKRITETVAADHDIVDSVSNGPEALEKIAAQDFDLLVVSLNLTHEDGLRLVSHLRSNERTRNLPIVMIGEEEDMDRIAHGLEIGAHDYIMRPVEKNELLARIRTQKKQPA